MAFNSCRFNYLRPVKYHDIAATYKTIIYKLVERNVSNSSFHLKKCSSKLSRFSGPPWKILFFGNDGFSLESLKPLNAKFNTGTLISSLAVVTGRTSLVRKFCDKEGLKAYEWPVDIEQIKGIYHVGIVVSFGHMISKAVIDAFPLGCLNIHSSILPKYRGAAPIIHAILNGDSETGVTLMKVHPYKFDVGEIVRQYRISIAPDETSTQLEERLAKCGSQLLMESIRDLPRCLDMAVPQPLDDICYAPKVKSSMAVVDWSRMTARDVYNQHRALSHVYPLSTTWRNSRVKFLHITFQNDSPHHRHTEPSFIDDSTEFQSILKNSALNFLNDAKSDGDVTNFKDSGKMRYSKVDKVLKVTCKDGNEIGVARLTISGKNISAMDFFNGYLSKTPMNEWRFDV